MTSDSGTNQRATGDLARTWALATDSFYLKWLGAIQLIRFPLFMSAFSYVLLSEHQRGSGRLGALLVSTGVIGGVLIAPVAGRTFDRIGPARSLPPSILSIAVAYLLVAVLLVADLWVLAMAANGIAFGLVLAVGGAMRRALSEGISSPKLSQALAFDAVVVEMIIIFAPLAAVLVSAFSVSAPLFFMSVLPIASCLLVISMRLPVSDDETTGCSEPGGARDEPPPGDERASSLRSNSVFLMWLGVAGMFGLVLGLYEIVVIPLSVSTGRPAESAVLLLAALGLASGLSGIVYAVGIRRFGSPAGRLAAVLFVCLSSTSFVAALMGSGSFVALIGIYGLAGICIAPINAIRAYAPELAIGGGQLSEAFGLMYAVQAVGYSVGASLIALLPPEALFPAAAVGAIVGALLSGATVSRTVSARSEPRGAERD